MTSMILSEKLLNFIAYDKEIYIKQLFANGIEPF